MDLLDLSIYYLGVLCFLACLTLQIMWWRTFSNYRSFKALLFFFILLPTLVFAILYIQGDSFFRILPPCLMATLLGSNFIAIYPALENTSPSLAILLSLKDGPKTEIQILKDIKKELFLKNKWNALIHSNLLYKRDEKYFLTIKGKLLANFFKFFRKSLCLSLGRG